MKMMWELSVFIVDIVAKCLHGERQVTAYNKVDIIVDEVINAPQLFALIILPSNKNICNERKRS